MALTAPCSPRGALRARSGLGRAEVAAPAGEAGRDPTAVQWTEDRNMAENCRYFRRRRRVSSVAGRISYRMVPECTHPEARPGRMYGIDGPVYRCPDGYTPVEAGRLNNVGKTKACEPDVPTTSRPSNDEKVAIPSPLASASRSSRTSVLTQKVLGAVSRRPEGRGAVLAAALPRRLDVATNDAAIAHVCRASRSPWTEPPVDRIACANGASALTHGVRNDPSLANRLRRQLVEAGRGVAKDDQSG